jgi:hypothetical protein
MPDLTTSADIDAFMAAANNAAALESLGVGATDSPAFAGLSVTGIRTWGGTRVTTAAAMGALAIDVTKGYNTKTIAADSTFTFSGTPATTNQWFGMFVINSDGSSHVLTIPSSFSVSRAGAITSVIIPANGKLMLVWNYDGSVYNLYGDPPLVSGTGSFALTTSPTFVTPILGTPTSGNLSNCTALPASAITAAVLGATITLGESTGNIALDAALSATGTWSGLTEAGTAGATLAFGDLVYYAPADSRWELADASGQATSGHVKLGVCVLAAAADGDPTNILLMGKVRADAAFPALSVGDPIYVSETAGDITDAMPTTEDAVIRVIGFANTADELYFTPSTDYITYTV